MKPNILAKFNLHRKPNVTSKKPKSNDIGSANPISLPNYKI